MYGIPTEIMARRPPSRAHSTALAGGGVGTTAPTIDVSAGDTVAAQALPSTAASQPPTTTMTPNVSRVTARKAGMPGHGAVEARSRRSANGAPMVPTRSTWAAQPPALSGPAAPTPL